VELDLDVLLAIRIADFLVADRYTAGDERLQPLTRDIVPDVSLEILHRHVQPVIDQLRVRLVADVLAAREDHFAGGTSAQILAYCVAPGTPAQFLGQWLERVGIAE